LGWLTTKEAVMHKKDVISIGLIVDKPVFFLHRDAKAKGYDISNLNIKKYYKTPEEIKEWEERVRNEVGLVIDGNELLRAGGSCCGTDGGMCDSE
jgi:hypothetical protein